MATANPQTRAVTVMGRQPDAYYKSQQPQVLDEYGLNKNDPNYINSRRRFEQSDAQRRGEVYIGGPASSGGVLGGIRSATGGGGGGTGLVSDYGAGGGNVPLSRGSYEEQQQALLNAKLQAEAEKRRLDVVERIGGGSSPRVSRGGGIDPNETAARAAAFARAKEQAGLTAQSAMGSIQDIMAARGLRGSTIEGTEFAKSISGGKGMIDEFTRDQLMLDLNRAADVADTTYAGDVTQRGQDLNRQQSLLGLIAGRGLY